MKDFKKPKCAISKGAARSIVNERCDAMACQWIERWIEQLVRENSYPPQLKSDDFVASLSKFLAPRDALAILERVRRDFRAAFSLNKEDDSLEGIIEVLRADPAVVAYLPPNCLTPT